MPEKRGDTLLNMMLFIEMFTLNRAWSDLSQDEYFWEPVPDCWSVRRRDECRTPNPFGAGEWVVDFDAAVVGRAVEGKAVEPITTIAWLYWHAGSMAGRAADLNFLGGTKSAESGWPSPYIVEHPVFIASNEAVEVMRTGWRALDHALRASSDESLEQVTRFWGGGPSAPGYQIIACLLNEISHHGTQICTLRDLYRAVDGRDLR